MQELLSKIASGLQAGLYSNEKAVSTSIVIPILRKLGWDDADPYEVRPEYQSGKGRVDFALFCSNGQPGLFIEVKAVGKAATADIQLFEYAFHEGAQIAVLTDGRVWSFYLPGQPGSYEDRKVHQIDLLERAPDDAEKRFIRYLRKDRVASNAAFEDAKADYNSKTTQKLATATIPKAWAELLAEPDIIKKLLRDRTEALCGHIPSDEALAIFVGSFLGTGSSVAPNLPAPAAIAPQAHVSPTSTPTAASGTGPSPLGWKLLGKNVTAKNQNEALAGLINELFLRFPDLVEHIASSVASKNRKHIAKSKEEIYPLRPDLGIRYSIQLKNGYFLGTNVSSGEKLKIAMKAAGACDLVWGSQVELII